MTRLITRRDFLKLGTVAVGYLAAQPIRGILDLPDFPQSSRLGRICEGRVDVKAKPDYDSATVSNLYEDAVIPWLREVLGRWPWRNNQRWVETPDGYIWSPYVQPVMNLVNVPSVSLPGIDDGEGIWVEVTVPYVDAIIDNPPARSSWLRYRLTNGLVPRFYYSQILWVDQIKKDEDANVWYRINERYGNPGDIFWARAEAFRSLTADEISPINPEVEDKRIVVDINYNIQTLSCYEGNEEVYYCRISSGKAEGSTPLTGTISPGFSIWRKLISIHMAGGTNADGWDLPGIGWTSLFHGDGVAIHSTFWHNNFGEPMSHGCVNSSPEDAKWVFRWTQPNVPFISGDITISGPKSTRVQVVQW